MSSITRFVAPSLNFAAQASSATAAALVGAYGMELLKYAVQNQFQLFSDVSKLAFNIFELRALGGAVLQFIRNPNHDPLTDAPLIIGSAATLQLQFSQNLAGYWAGASMGHLGSTLYSCSLKRDEDHFMPRFETLGATAIAANLGDYLLSQGRWESGCQGLPAVGMLGARAVHLAGKASSAMGYRPSFLQSALLIGTLAPEAFPTLQSYLSLENSITFSATPLRPRLNSSSILKA